MAITEHEGQKLNQQLERENHAKLGPTGEEKMVEEVICRLQ